MTTEVQAGTGPLSRSEEARFNELKKIVTDSLRTAFVWGRALAEIRDAKLYRETHGDFESFVRAEWNFTVRRARQLISAAKTVRELEAFEENGENSVFYSENPANGTNCSHFLPDSESQTRELDQLETPAEKQAAWSDAVAESPKQNGKPKVTAKAVKKAVEKVKATRVKPAAEDEEIARDAERDEEPAEPAVPWAEFEGQIADIIRDLRAAHRKMAAVLEYQADGKQLKAKWAKWYSYGGTLAVVNGLIHTLEQGLPAQLKGNSFISVDQLSRLESFEKSKKGVA